MIQKINTYTANVPNTPKQSKPSFGFLLTPDQALLISKLPKAERDVFGRQLLAAADEPTSFGRDGILKSALNQAKLLEAFKHVGRAIRGFSEEIADAVAI